jgi:hypothetical protein
MYVDYILFMQRQTDISNNMNEREVSVPEYRFYQHMCECEHGQTIHDYKVVHVDSESKTEREHLNCRHLDCRCTKYVERTYPR